MINNENLLLARVPQPQEAQQLEESPIPHVQETDPWQELEDNHRMWETTPYRMFSRVPPGWHILQDPRRIWSHELTLMEFWGDGMQRQEHA